MATAHISVKSNVPLGDAPRGGHNRWHPDIPPILCVRDGDTVEIETWDSWDCQIKPATRSEDVLSANLGRAHPLTGPIYVEGAMPGDILGVEVINVQPTQPGYTVVMPGFGFLRDVLKKPYVVHWELGSSSASSAELPGVRIPGAPFMGVMGVAPSRDLLSRISSREREAAGAGGLVFLEDPEGAVPSTEIVRTEGLRTIPSREFGGNVDIRQAVAGTTVYFPVFVKGALFSVGDAHFAQGDGETCGTAIETAAVVTVRFSLKHPVAGARRLRTPELYNPTGSPGVVSTAGYYATTGICVTDDGVNRPEDITLSARNAVLEMIEYLRESRGYSDYQAYALVSVAVSLRISQCVDVPNPVVSAFLPLDIFA